MSLATQPLATGEEGYPIDMTNTGAFDDRSHFRLTSQSAAFDEPIFDKFYEADNRDIMAPSPKRIRTSDNAPELPPKSALRAPKMLDNHGLKAVEATELAQATTPHDVYLSSEEDASSDAGDLSDFDIDSSDEDPTSPTRRSSREDLARVVSVVFAGKPSIVDLAATRKRPVSSSSLGTARSRASSASSSKPPASMSDSIQERPVTPASTTSSQYSQPRPKKDTTPNRRSTLLSEILIKKKPPFLSIDPYAPGSTYALDVPKALDSLEGENNSARTPRTPTALLKGVTRSFSLVRRRSRPNLSSPLTAVPKLDTAFSSNSNRASVQSPAVALHVDEQQQQSKENREQHQHQHQQEQQQQQQQQDQTRKQEQQPRTPMTPITYTDILKAVKKSATMMGAPSPPSDILSPTSPNGPAATTTRRGILSGLSTRRRSVKLTGKS
ncbi:hypothetical protein C8A03DRAFT_12496 [Achaetomium macrosporum]|uniref:Uncharacterized protein n=1 Tax=Achaetomium macrosporum TaxID=79813 RepID=A0AAN7HF84_9PEZI|nr:hypothetical protein C8A03DRAFT_12496 [Achaetomium macrosporum]